MSSSTGVGGGSRDKDTADQSTPNRKIREATPHSTVSSEDERKCSELRTKRGDSSSTSSNSPSVFTFHEDHIQKGGGQSSLKESPLRQLESCEEINKQGSVAGVAASGSSSSVCTPHPTLGGSWANGRDKGLRVSLAATHLNNMSTPITSEVQWSTPTAPPHSPGALSWHGEIPNSSDKDSEGIEQRSGRASRKELYKVQRQHYCREKQKAASALLTSLGDPSIIILADWLKVRGSLKSWTKRWCVLKPGLLLLYKSPKTKSNQWVGTVLLNTCHVMERPSKKEGFCFKLYHPLEQGIWAPRGPHNEAIGAVVQPLPSSHLIFRAPSKAAGHCWLDGLELAQRCSNSLLRNSRVLDATTNHETQWSPEDMEKHFAQQVKKLFKIMEEFIPDQSCVHSDVNFKSFVNVDDQYVDIKDLKMSVNRWSKIVDSFTDGESMVVREVCLDDEDSSEEEKVTPVRATTLSDVGGHKMDKRRNSAFHLDFFKKNISHGGFARGIFKEKLSPKSSVGKSHNEGLSVSEDVIEKVKRSFSDPFNNCDTLTDLKAHEEHSKVQLHSQAHNFFEENLLKIVSAFPKRRSSTPSAFFKIGIKEETETKANSLLRKLRQDHEKHNETNKFCNEISISTDPYARKRSLLGFTSSVYPSGRMSAEPRVYRSGQNEEGNGDDVVFRHKLHTSEPQSRGCTSDKFSLIKFDQLPSVNIGKRQEAISTDRHSQQGFYVTGKIVKELELSESDSDGGVGGAQEEERAEHAPFNGEEPDHGQEDQAGGVLAILNNVYVDEGSDDIVQKGEVVEELAEENKGLLWYLIKQVRPGMDLSRVALPTFVLEPRSFLDKLSDSFYHADILSRAVKELDPYTRMKTVVTWYLSGLYKKPKGLKKPYNPVLGELFRCCWLHQNGTRTYYIAEQVSHHPPVSAFYVSNRKEGYTVQATILAKSKFYGNSTSAILEGRAAVHLLELGEVYLCTSPYAHCGGLLLGTLSMELGGRVSIHCPTTNYTADIDFKLKPFIGGSDSINMISGRIRHNKDTMATLEGHWDGRIDIKDKKTQEEGVLLDVSELKHKRLRRQLVAEHHLGDLESQKLWIKVSEAINKDDQTAATEEKIKIEEAQRMRAREAGGRVWQPAHFTRESLYNEGEHQTFSFLYNFQNPTPWDDMMEVLEYEESFVIKSLRRQSTAHEIHIEQSASETDSVGSRGAEVVMRARGVAGVEGNIDPAVVNALLKIEQALGDYKNTLREVVNAVHRLEDRERKMGAHTQTTRIYTRSTVGALLLGYVIHWIYAWWGGRLDHNT